MSRTTSMRFPFPQQQRRAANYGQDRRPMFGGSRGRGGSGSSFKIRLLIALAIAAFAFISYVTKPGDLNEVTGEVEKVAMADEGDEIQLGLQAKPEMVSMHGGPSRNVAAQQQVQQVGWRLLEGLDRQLDEYNKAHPDANRHNPYEKAFQFTLLADPKTVNAFALPGGQVFITEALYRALETEGQLAGVLGHEIGHVISRHGNKQMARQGLFQGLAGAIGVLGGNQQSAQMAQMVSSAIFMKYGREAELESDDWGVKLTYQAGYDPRAMEGVMRILDEAAGGASPPEFLSTHPKPANRVAYIDAAIKKYFPDGVPDGLRQ
ncbi:M48 family metallopeptidase [Bythopirellula polymerisocia]|uniref:TPR repeat-containing protein YfgC n=1 Tax=Bythopirellula polymerisocia TaxID=2528003 RepID=A0A5C6D0B2_9BACT|nr:M48 family metallopeptidase [Bythopirellula polymerisocia]TWU30148.1 TPR repeat-containing protein YfgC precursor [Bythopirellula polymerisocia]